MSLHHDARDDSGLHDDHPDLYMGRREGEDVAAEAHNALHDPDPDILVR